MKKYILTLLCLAQIPVHAQSKIWYFGYNAGISFKSDSALAITDGNMTSIDGCATIADKSDNILFYSNGLKLWDKSMSITSNGDSLMGAASSCQSSVFIPFPGDSTQMILATMDMIENNGAKGLRYSVIDMTLNGGKGDIVSGKKNMLLTKPACEKLLAVPHKNGTDVWLITYKPNTDSILSYLITSNGVSHNAVRSNTGYTISGDLNKTLGYLKCSGNFKKLASAHYLESKVLLMDFNNSTGKVSNVLQWDVTSPDGVEFAPNDSLLYVSGFRGPAALYQYDITSGNASAIKNSEKTIFIFSGAYDVGALQLAPDNKIYLAKNNQSYLGVINNPNEIGSSCNFVSDGFYLQGKTSAYGLPDMYDPIGRNILHVDKVSHENEIRIFPNPGGEILNISGLGNVKINNILIFDNNGKLLFEKTVNTDNYILKMNEYACGLYFINLYTNKGYQCYKWLKAE